MGFLGGFDSSIATGFGERRFYGNSLCARLTPSQLRGIWHIGVLYGMHELAAHPTGGEVLSYACYRASKVRVQLDHRNEDLERSRRELARMEVDVHAAQVRASSMQACAQSLEAVRVYQVYFAPSMDYGYTQGCASSHAFLLHRAGKRVRKEVEVAMVPIRAPAQFQTALMPLLYLDFPLRIDSYAAIRTVGYATTRVGGLSSSDEKVLVCGGEDPHESAGVTSSPRARRYPSLTTLPGSATIAGSSNGKRHLVAAQPGTSSTTADAPLGAYRPRLRDQDAS